uniref:Uncharacterized protein n=1 Tax=Candidatus Kentrum sp. LFY TaxID=2126342 RepID=A0A450WWT7_9GAMM|nr:MAG: hypothetical protein BECKLFY1418C_GA0070996_10939 [Candidatus Kentron sp. LFY]
MKQDPLNQITELICGIADRCIRLIPGSYPFFRYMCGLLHSVSATDAKRQAKGENAGAGFINKEVDAGPVLARKADDAGLESREPIDADPEPIGEAVASLPRSPHPVEKVPIDELPAERRCWTGNDANRRNYHGRIPEGEDPVHLELHWKKNGKAPRKLVGGFILDVAALAEEGYLTQDSSGGIRIRFIRESDGYVYIGRGSDKRIPIGKVVLA